jgi:hypothetical protein
MCCYLFLFAGKTADLIEELDLHSIKICGINSQDRENCSETYCIAWKDFREGKNGFNFAENKSYVIGSLCFISGVSEYFFHKLL